MKKLYELPIKGRKKQWGFEVWLEEKHIKDYLEDGLQLDEIVASIPAWVVMIGFTTPYLWIKQTIDCNNVFMTFGIGFGIGLLIGVL